MCTLKKGLSLSEEMCAAIRPLISTNRTCLSSSFEISSLNAGKKNPGDSSDQKGPPVGDPEKDFPLAHSQQSFSLQLHVPPVRASCRASRPSWRRKETRARAASTTAALS